MQQFRFPLPTDVLREGPTLFAASTAPPQVRATTSPTPAPLPHGARGKRPPRPVSVSPQGASAVASPQGTLMLEDLDGPAAMSRSNGRRTPDPLPTRLKNAAASLVLERDTPEPAEEPRGYRHPPVVTSPFVRQPKSPLNPALTVSKAGMNMRMALPRSVSDPMNLSQQVPPPTHAHARVHGEVGIVTVPHTVDLPEPEPEAPLNAVRDDLIAAPVKRQLGTDPRPDSKAYAAYAEAARSDIPPLRETEDMRRETLEQKFEESSALRDAEAPHGSPAKAVSFSTAGAGPKPIEEQPQEAPPPPPPPSVGLAALQRQPPTPGSSTKKTKRHKRRASKKHSHAEADESEPAPVDPAQPPPPPPPPPMPKPMTFQQQHKVLVDTLVGTYSCPRTDAEQFSAQFDFVLHEMDTLSASVASLPVAEAASAKHTEAAKENEQQQQQKEDEQQQPTPREAFAEPAQASPAPASPAATVDRAAAGSGSSPSLLNLALKKQIQQQRAYPPSLYLNREQFSSMMEVYFMLEDEVVVRQVFEALAFRGPDDDGEAYVFIEDYASFMSVMMAGTFEAKAKAMYRVLDVHRSQRVVKDTVYRMMLPLVSEEELSSLLQPLEAFYKRHTHMSEAALLKLARHKPSLVLALPRFFGYDSGENAAGKSIDFSASTDSLGLTGVLNSPKGFERKGSLVLVSKGDEIVEVVGAFKFDEFSTPTQGNYTLSNVDKYEPGTTFRRACVINGERQRGVGLVISKVERTGFFEVSSIRFHRHIFSQDMAAAWWEEFQQYFSRRTWTPALRE